MQRPYGVCVCLVVFALVQRDERLVVEGHVIKSSNVKDS